MWLISGPVGVGAIPDRWLFATQSRNFAIMMIHVRAFKVRG